MVSPSIAERIDDRAFALATLALDRVRARLGIGRAGLLIPLCLSMSAVTLLAGAAGWRMDLHGAAAFLTLSAVHAYQASDARHAVAARAARTHRDEGPFPWKRFRAGLVMAATSMAAFISFLTVGVAWDGSVPIAFVPCMLAVVLYGFAVPGYFYLWQAPAAEDAVRGSRPRG